MAEELDLELVADEDAEGSPDLPIVLERAMASVAERMHTAAPGVIGGVNASTGTVSVQQAVTRKGEDPEPLIPDVPVLQVHGPKGGLRIPVAPGPALLVHSNRSLDEWAATDGTKVVEAGDARTHDPTDAMALPCSPGPCPEHVVLEGLDGAEVHLGSEDASSKVLGIDAIAETALLALPEAGTEPIAIAVVKVLKALLRSSKVKVS